MDKCKFCEGVVDDRFNLITNEDEESIVVYIDGDNFLTLMDGEDMSYESKINFCPMCGKNLIK